MIYIVYLGAGIAVDQLLMHDCYAIILAAIVRGDEHALAQLFHHFHDRLVAFANSILQSAELSEDAVEDVFIKLWRNREQLKPVSNIPVYLYVATKNTALNARSKKLKDMITEPFDILEIDYNHPNENPYQILVAREMHWNMQRAIDNLPPRCKLIFKLVREDGFKYKDVAAILNISVNTIDAQMAIAVKRISQALQVSKKALTAG